MKTKSIRKFCLGKNMCFSSGAYFLCIKQDSNVVVWKANSARVWEKKVLVLMGICTLSKGNTPTLQNISLGKASREKSLIIRCIQCCKKYVVMCFLPLASSLVGELVNDILRGTVKQMKELHWFGSLWCVQLQASLPESHGVWKCCYESIPRRSSMDCFL